MPTLAVLVRRLALRVGVGPSLACHTRLPPCRTRHTNCWGGAVLLAAMLGHHLLARVPAWLPC